MRISTQDIFDPGALIRNQAEVMKTQQQISMGRRISSPADDPVGAAEALRLRQASELTAQYQANQQSAMNTLVEAESILGDVTNLLQDIRTSLVAAGNATLSNSDRKTIAQEISGRLEQLIGDANSRSAAGGYLFAGYSDAGQPFSKSGAGIAYLGDQGGRALQVSDSRAIEVSTSGSTIFERIRTGNGTFVAAPAAGNLGSGVADSGRVTDATALTGHDYQVRFSPGAGGASEYDVVDTTTSTTVVSAAPYASGAAIGFDGMQFEISGQPAPGDVFNVTPSASQSVFTTLQNVINALGTAANTAAEHAVLANAISSAMQNLDNAHEQVLSVRSSMGSRMQEIATLQNMMGDRDTAVKAALSKIEDLDYAEAISRLSRQQLVLQAAQKSYVGVTQLSLFSFL